MISGKAVMGEEKKVAEVKIVEDTAGGVGIPIIGDRDRGCKKSVLLKLGFCILLAAFGSRSRTCKCCTWKAFYAAHDSFLFNFSGFLVKLLENI
jgi:hypothetical protein